MLNTTQMPPWMFNLEGTFLGFSSKNPDKPKSLVLEVEQERMTIKLPKKLRNVLEQPLKLGDRIRCIGRSQLHLDIGIVKLEADYLFLLTPAPEIPSFQSETETLNSSPETAPSLSSSQSFCPKARAAQKEGKILVCKKSKCQKRGGHQLVSTLKHILKEHQIQHQVKIQYSGCQKRCSKNPSLTIMPGKHRYDRIKLEKVSGLIKKHFGTSQLPSTSNPVDS